MPHAKSALPRVGGGDFVFLQLLTFYYVYANIVLPSKLFPQERRQYMNIIEIIKTKIRVVRHKAMLDRVIADAPAIAASFGWDPQSQWVINTVDYWSSCVYLSEHHFRYDITKSFDPSSYWRYIESGAVRIEARYDVDTHPSPVEIAVREAGIPNIIDAFDSERIGKIVVGSHLTHVYSKNGQLAYEFVGYGRKAHYNDAFRAKNASKLINNLIGFEIDWREVVQNDLGSYNDITFTLEDGVWSQTISTKAHSA